MVHSHGHVGAILSTETRDFLKQIIILKSYDFYVQGELLHFTKVVLKKKFELILKLFC